MISAEDFQAQRNVSRETMDRLVRYESLLRKWNPAINLVARSTLESLWVRHFLDSAQVFDLAPEKVDNWVDLGSGGGFPGMVVAILAAAERPELRVTLVESDTRKAAFLASLNRELDVRAEILVERIEALSPLRADILTARALGPLDQLLAYADKHLRPSGTALFQKGAKYGLEVDQALEKWHFSLQKNVSKTDPGAVILTIGGIKRV